MDVQPLEHDNVSLVLRLSKPGSVTWLRGSDDLSLVASGDDRFKTAVSVSGLQHSLTIIGIECEDGGQFSAIVDDGAAKSLCHVTVRGKET